MLIPYQYEVQKIIKEAIYQKAFAHYVDENILFAFFRGDSQILSLLYEISIMKVICVFRKALKTRAIYQTKLNK